MKAVINRWMMSNTIYVALRDEAAIDMIYDKVNELEGCDCIRRNS